MATGGALGRLNVVIGADSAEFSSGLTRAQHLANKFTKDTTGGLKKIEQQTKRTADSVSSMSSSFSIIGRSLAGALSVQAVVQYADAWQGLQNRLSLVTNGSNELAQATEAVFDISQKTSQALSTTAEVYQRFAQSADSLGLSLGEVNELVEITGKAVAISGASLASAQAALTQFGQGLASGQLRGQEFNSVVEQIPGLAQAISRGLGKNIGDLRALAAEGGLTSEVIIAALRRASGFIDTQFNTRVKTVSQSFQELQNSVTRFFGEAGQSTGGARALVATLDAIGNNFETLTSAALILAAGKVASVIQIKTKAQLADISATIAARNAATAKIQTEIAEAQATVANTAATNAAIVAARAEVVAKLAALRTTIANTQATIAAATALGAQSAALRTLAIAQNDLVAAEARRVVLTRELAALGAAQTAQTAAQAVAARTAAAAQASLAASTGLAARALGLLGGPIGAVTIALTAGVTAWQLWGDSATKESEAAAADVERSTHSIVTAMQRQLDKINEARKAREDAAAEASGQGVFRAPPGAVEQVTALAQQRAAAVAGTGQFQGVPENVRGILASQFKTEIDSILGKMRELNDAQEQLNSEAKKATLAALMEKYAVGVEKAANAIAEAERTLGGPLPAELRQAILDKFDKGAQKQEKSAAKLLEAGEKEIQQLREQLGMIGAVTEAQKLSASIAAGTSALQTDAQRQTAISLAETIDARHRDIEAIHEQQAALDELIAKSVERQERVDELTGRAERMQREQDLTLLEQRFDVGDINLDEYIAGINKVNGVTEKVTDNMSQFAIQAGRTIQNALGDTLFDVLTGQFDDIGLEFAKMLARMAAQAAAAQILQGFFGFLGEQGGTIGSIGKSLLGAGRAIGGPVAAGSLHEVNERGPELLTSGGRTFLMQGGQAGFVTPITPSLPGGERGAAGGFNVTTVVNIAEGRASSESQGDTTRDGRNLSRVIEESVRATIQRETRQGGIIWNITNG